MRWNCPNKCICRRIVLRFDYLSLVMHTWFFYAGRWCRFYVVVRTRKDKSGRDMAILKNGRIDYKCCSGRSDKQVIGQTEVGCGIRRYARRDYKWTQQWMVLRGCCAPNRRIDEIDRLSLLSLRRSSG